LSVNQRCPRKTESEKEEIDTERGEKQRERGEIQSQREKETGERGGGLAEKKRETETVLYSLNSVFSQLCNMHMHAHAIRI
jgi:hypothetical protein